MPFPKGICPKVNVIARLELELAYYDSEVHRFNHYTTRTPTPDFLNGNIRRLASFPFKFCLNFHSYKSGLEKRLVLRLNAVIVANFRSFINQVKVLDYTTTKNSLLICASTVLILIPLLPCILVFSISSWLVHYWTSF